MTKPSELDPYAGGQDYNFHGHRPGESVRVSIDDVVPAGGVVNSKRNLEETGHYYKADGRMMDGASDPQLKSLYALTDPLGINAPSTIYTYENKAVKVARGFQTMALEPATQDLYYVDTLDRLCKITAASGYATAELVETGISGIAFTESRTYKCLSSNGDCVVINHFDSSERTIPASIEPALAGAYSRADGFDYVAVGDKIWSVDDNSATEYSRATNTIYLLAKVDDRIFYVPKNDESGIFDIDDTSNYFQIAGGSAPISSLVSVSRSLVAFQPSGSGYPAHITLMVVYAGAVYPMSSTGVELDYLVPLATTAYLLTTISPMSYHSMFTTSRGTEQEYDYPVDPTMVDAGAQHVYIGADLFFNSGSDSNGDGSILMATVQDADPNLIRLPSLEGDGLHQAYLRRG